MLFSEQILQDSDCSLGSQYLQMCCFREHLCFNHIRPLCLVLLLVKIGKCLKHLKKLY